MKVTFSGEARYDLLRISDHIARDSPRRALGFIRKLRQQAEKLKHQPLALPVLRRYEHIGLRRHVFRGYLILYKVEADRVVIVRVVHGARDYEALIMPEP